MVNAAEKHRRFRWTGLYLSQRNGELTLQFVTERRIPRKAGVAKVGTDLVGRPGTHRNDDSPLVCSTEDTRRSLGPTTKNKCMLENSPPRLPLAFAPHVPVQGRSKTCESQVPDTSGCHAVSRCFPGSPYRSLSRWVSPVALPQRKERGDREITAARASVRRLRRARPKPMELSKRPQQTPRPLKKVRLGEWDGI